MLPETNKENIDNNFYNIKKELKKILINLKNLKGVSQELLSHELDELYEYLTDYKSQTVQIGNKTLESITKSTKEKPVRNLLYSFIIGLMVAKLLSRR